MLKVQLDSADIDRIEVLLANVLAKYLRVDSEPFITDATVWSHELPWRLREQINELRLLEADDGVLVISGFPVDQLKIGATPPALTEFQDSSLTFREETYLILVAVLLGDLIAWSTQQSGHIVHDVFPVRKHQDLQLGTGSRQLLTWHTEDAFHPYRADYLAILCLRNPDRVPTTVSSIASINLDEETRYWLSQPHFMIHPDESHRGATDIKVTSGDSRDMIQQMLTSAESNSVLFGHAAHPYWRLDPYFMPTPATDGARRALQTLIEQIDANIIDVVLQPGDVCIMDNFRVVHGRRPFEARFDGTDRWLKRVLVARDLRKSVAVRHGGRSRIIN